MGLIELILFQADLQYSTGGTWQGSLSGIFKKAQCEKQKKGTMCLGCVGGPAWISLLSIRVCLHIVGTSPVAGGPAQATNLSA